VDWEAKISYRAGAQDKTFVVNDEGHPFTVTSPLNSAGYDCTERS
jgi:hypothetical protein